MSRVFIGLGSNEGERLEHLSKAVQALQAVPGVRVTQMATIQETEPAGGPPQGPYLNTVVELETTLSPETLLQALQAIERQHGRLPTAERWGPRPLDLDLLLYDDRVLQTPALRVPHPRLHERRFVLEPLSQLASELIHPVLGDTIAHLLQLLPTPTVVRGSGFGVLAPSP
jgi:2-amino-4-hydroxy-6-hydroxymethyldihydropteridine diphosphokinase